ncbi:hypothetical protein [Pseudoalteromonas sp. NJ631]|uniref:hypothetical protein n=1 Tax=Pseudoalteromonas sp. NJ631 TaxID=493915 RepID=UPI00030FC3D9|nr:hypothetical protein [Pseudoalteromonas sp. NJ631]
MGAHIFNTELNDEQTPCTLELQLQGLNGKDCTVPLGFAEVQRASSPKPDDQIPFVETVELRVFSEASLDINKAKAPEYVPMFKDQKEFQEDEPVGYYYFFVNGYLWREIAAISGGMLSEVDLREYHGQSFRPNNGTHMPRLTLPIRAKGLFSDSTSVETMTYQVAFSRVQWSWDYISALGDMKPDDSRFDEKPMTSKCPEEGKASTYRSERMQTIDFSLAPNWDSIENLKANENGEPCIYLHDVLGIAQKYYLEGEAALHSLRNRQTELSKNGFQKSALIAHKLLFDESLYEIDYTKMRNRLATNLYEQNDSTSKVLRKAAALVSEDKLEQYLLGEKPQEVVNELQSIIDARNNLYDIYNRKIEAQNTTLSNLCSRNNIASPPTQKSVLIDFSTLEQSAFDDGLGLTSEHFLLLTMPDDSIPLYIDSMVNKTELTRIRKDLQLQQSKALEFVWQHFDNESSFFNVLFCAHPDAYGDMLKSSIYDEELISSELGEFTPKKFKSDIQGNQHINMGGSIFNVAKGGVDISLKGVQEYVALQQQLAVLKFEKIPPSERLLHIVGATIKARSPSWFGELEIHSLGAIPNDRVAITKEFVDLPVLQKLVTGEAKKPFQRILRQASNGKQANIAKRDLEVVAGALKLKIKGPGNKPHNAEMLKKTKEVIIALALRVSDIKEVQDTVLRGKSALTMPKTSLYKGGFAFNVAQELGGDYSINGISSTKANLGAQLINKSVAHIVFMLVSYSTYLAYSDYKKNFEGKGESYEDEKNVAIIGAQIAASASLFNAINQVKEVEHAIKIRSSILLFTKLRLFSGIVGAIGTRVLFKDAIKLIEKNDTVAGTAMLVASGVTFFSAVYGIFAATMGPVGWALLVGSIITTIVAESLIESKLEIWAKNGPFSKSGENLPAFINPEKYHNYINSILFEPKVSISNLGDNAYLVKVLTPRFEVGVSDLSLVVNYEYRHKVTLNKHKGTWVYGTQDYNPTFSKENEHVSGDFYFNIPDDVTSISISPKLILDNYMTLPIDYESYETGGGY